MVLIALLACDLSFVHGVCVRILIVVTHLSHT